MPEIRVQHVVSCSSEDKNHPSENLLKPEGTFKWKCATAGEKSATVVLQFEKASQISSIDIGNEGSAFVEVLVGKSTASADTDYQVLLVASSFMSPLESRNGTNRNSVRMFCADKLSKISSVHKWDRVKIVCTQPFCKTATYGLSFIKFHSPSDGKEPENPPAQKTLGAFKLKAPEPDDIKIGSLFTKRNEKPEPPPIKGAAAARAASKMADESRPSASSQSFHRQAEDKPSPAKRKHSVSDDDTPAPAPASKTPTTKTPLRKQSSSMSSTVSSSSKGEATPPLKRVKTDPPKPSAGKLFHKLMEKVVFVMSGFQNPYRGELREKALEMGAKYKPDWGRGCTHLICAFANTPKFNHVNGKGKIVTKNWILDCHKQKKLLPWRKYRLGDADSPDESSSDEEPLPTPPPQKRDSAKKPPKKTTPQKMDDDMYGGATDSGEDTEDEIRRAKEKVAKHEAAALSRTPSKTSDPDPFGGSTDEDEDVSTATLPMDDEDDVKATVVNDDDDDDDDDDADSGLPDLPDFFAEKNFFLYGDFPADERRLMVRYIAAYDGCLEEYMTDTVKYVITASKWDDNFNEALTENPNLVFVKPKWIRMCHEKQKLLPYQPYIVVPT